MAAASRDSSACAIAKPNARSASSLLARLERRDAAVQRDDRALLEAGRRLEREQRLAALAGGDDAAPLGAAFSSPRKPTHASSSLPSCRAASMIRAPARRYSRDFAAASPARRGTAAARGSASSTRRATR